MDIIYLHHANRDEGYPPSQDDDLTALGREDAELISRLFKARTSADKKGRKSKFVAIYTSAHYRCTETSKIINKVLNIPVIVDDRLNEYKSMGEETWREYQARIMQLIGEIAASYSADATIICVTSGLGLAAFINYFYHLEPSENAPYIHIPSCSPVIFTVKD